MLVDITADGDVLCLNGAADIADDDSSAASGIGFALLLVTPIWGLITWVVSALV